MIIKKSIEHKTATFVVIEPEVVDRNGDIVSRDAIIEAAHEFMLNLSDKSVNFDHENNTDTQEAQYVESYILPVDITYQGLDGLPKTVLAGSWLIGIKFSDNLWEKLQNGEFSWISLEWRGIYA